VIESQGSHSIPQRQGESEILQLELGDKGPNNFQFKLRIKEVTFPITAIQFNRQREYESHLFIRGFPVCLSHTYYANSSNAETNVTLRNLYETVQQSQIQMSTQADLISFQQCICKVK
jgi:hypothetical protein